MRKRAPPVSGMILNFSTWFRLTASQSFSLTSKLQIFNEIKAAIRNSNIHSPRWLEPWCRLEWWRKLWWRAGAGSCVTDPRWCTYSVTSVTWRSYFVTMLGRIKMSFRPQWFIFGSDSSSRSDNLCVLSKLVKSSKAHLSDSDLQVQFDFSTQHSVVYNNLTWALLPGATSGWRRSR